MNTKLDMESFLDFVGYEVAAMITDKQLPANTKVVAIKPEPEDNPERVLVMLTTGDTLTFTPATGEEKLDGMTWDEVIEGFIAGLIEEGVIEGGGVEVVSFRAQGTEYADVVLSNGETVRIETTNLGTNAN